MRKARTRIKKPLAMALVLLMMLGVAACGGGTGQTPQPANNASGQSAPAPAPAPQPPAQPQPQAQPPAPAAPEAPADVELIVFAAASLTNTLEEIAGLYKAVAPHVTLVYNFDSSGTLKTQIEEGADCDVFLSAAQRQMNELAELDFLQQGSRTDILENKVALVVAPGNPKGITSFDNLVAALLGGDILLAMGNSDVPVGQYTQRIFEFFNLDEDALARSGVLTYGSNVREVTTQVTEASVDVGIVYATDAFSTRLEIVDTATAAMCGQVIYPASVLNISTNVEEAQAFLDYLFTNEAMAVFESVGFSPA